MTEPDMRDAHETARARDARGTDFHREWLYVMDTQHPHTPQENDMTDLPRTVITLTGDRGPLHVAKGVLVNGSPVTVAEHGVDIDFGPDEVTTVTLRLLADEVHFVKPERVEVKVAPFDPDVIAANLRAIKHEVETPIRGHGGCCEPADITEEPPVGPGVRMVTIRWDDARKLLNLARTAWRVAGRGEAHPTRLDQRTSAALDAAPVSVARAAREHIEDSLKVYYRDLYDKAEADLARVTKERDEQTRDAIEWRNRYDALRADVEDKFSQVEVEDRGHMPAFASRVLKGILARDTERAES